MPSLRELQAGFAADLLAGEATRTPPHLVDGGFPGARRLQVYRNNVLASLRGALADIFPVVARLVGEGFFSYLAHEYVRAHPSRSGNLHEFGAALPGFLAAFEPARELAYLPDVARLEWAWHAVFHAAEHGPLALERLAGVPAERHESLVFTLHPARRVVASGHPVLSIWEANQPGADGTADLAAGPEQGLVMRRDLEVIVRRLAPAEHAFLAALAGGQTLGGACEAALALDPDLDLGACLGGLVAEHTLVDFRPA